MPSQLVRIVLDIASNNFIVEYGERRVAGLTQSQQNEMKQLNEDLMEFSDFALAENLEDEQRQELMEKKKRFEELAEKEVMEHIEWYPLEQHLIETLLIVVSPRLRHTYVENIPPKLLDRIMDPQITLNITGQPISTLPSVSQPEQEAEVIVPRDNDMGALQAHTQAELAVIRVIAPDMPEWADLLTVKEEGDSVFIRPNAFLAERWNPINRALREVYGECWKSTGKGDKSAHWEVPT